MRVGTTIARTGRQAPALCSSADASWLHLPRKMHEQDLLIEIRHSRHSASGNAEFATFRSLGSEPATHSVDATASLAKEAELQQLPFKLVTDMNEFGPDPP